MPLYHGETGRVVDDLKRWSGDGWRVAVVFPANGPAERAAEVLRDAGLGVSIVDSIDTEPPNGVVTITTGGLDHGFVDEAARLAIVTGNDISGGRGSSTRDMGKMPARRRNTIDPLELRAGDFVVHEQHGIGRYVEMVQRTVNGAEREYLVIEYAPSKRNQPGDRLFVPTDSLDQLSRYVGGENPTLHKMGGSDWQKSKARARKAVREIAAQLIQLYAARQSSKGHAFGPDTPWQRELEDAFPYTETPDQLAAIEEVKADMRKEVPMDRLICGDVGYGKTEIAVRAAFKAVQDGKQVAVLVPTTLLAQQHFNTFSERMAQFPVVVKQLSRFIPPKESALTLEGLANGTVDIVIGTHRSAATVHEVPARRADHCRRGAALRCRAQGVPEDAAGTGRRVVDVGDADPAHAGDGDHRDPRDVDDRHAAGGAAPCAHVRRRTGRQAGGRRHPPRTAARRAGLLPAQPDRVDRAGGAQAARACPRGAGRGRARADERRTRWSASWSASGRRSTTSWSAPRSSRAASTSRTPTR
jgi:hypothetical protein